MRKIKTVLLGAIAFATCCATPFTYGNTPFNTDMGVSNEQIEIEYYGRNALSKLDNATALLYAYDKVVDCVEKSLEEIEVWDKKNPISQEEFKVVMDAYRRDHGEHFWLGNGYTLSNNSDSITKYAPSYLFSGEALEYKKAAFENAVTEILSGVTTEMNEFEKELYLHDALAEKASYVLDAENAHNAYGAIVEGQTVCEGYAEGLQYLLQRAGIQSFLAVGASVNPSSGTGEPHAWNYVRVGGKFYQVDLTWNDQTNYLYHSYFNQPQAVFSVDHSYSEAAFELPVCDSVEANYFNVKGGRLNSFTVDGVSSLLKNSDMRASVYTDKPDELISWYSDNIQAIAKKVGVSGKFSYGYSRLGNEVLLIIETCQHSWQDATCTTPKTCLLCNQTEGEANGHADAPFEYDENGHWKTCVVCSNRFRESGHLYGDWEITQKPTESQDGEKVKTCECGHTISERIPAGTVLNGSEEEKKNPFAGCMGNIALSGASVLLGSLAIALVLLNRKKAK